MGHVAGVNFFLISQSGLDIITDILLSCTTTVTVRVLLRRLDPRVECYWSWSTTLHIKTNIGSNFLKFSLPKTSPLYFKMMSKIFFSKRRISIWSIYRNV